jgi:hypothetical protein
MGLSPLATELKANNAKLKELSKRMYGQVATKWGGIRDEALEILRLLKSKAGQHMTAFDNDRYKNFETDDAVLAEFVHYSASTFYVNNVVQRYSKMLHDIECNILEVAEGKYFYRKIHF